MTEPKKPLEKPKASDMSTDAMFVALMRRLIEPNGGAMGIAKKDNGEWVVSAEYGKEAPDSPMVGAATYGLGGLRKALRVAGIDAGLWTEDDDLGDPDQRQTRVLILEAPPSDTAIGNIYGQDVVQGSLSLMADADEVFVIRDGEANCVKHAHHLFMGGGVATAIQRQSPEPDVLKRIRDLAPHEVKCTCSHGGEFDMALHNEGCARKQLAHVLATVEAQP